MTAEASTSRAWPGRGRDGGLRMRDSPAAATIWRPLTMPEPPAEAGEDPDDPGGDDEGVGGPDDGHQGHAQDQAEDHPRGRDDGGGEDLARGAVAEQADAPLEAAVEGPADDAADRRS